MELIRNHGTINKFNDNYFIVPFTEYSEDGSIKQLGEEDFSKHRLQTLHKWLVCQKTERKNKGGFTIWDYKGCIHTTSVKNARIIALAKYGNGEYKLEKIC